MPVDYDVFRSIPLVERTGKRVHGTRGIRLDQPVAPGVPQIVPLKFGT